MSILLSLFPHQDPQDSHLHVELSRQVGDRSQERQLEEQQAVGDLLVAVETRQTQGTEQRRLQHVHLDVEVGGADRVDVVDVPDGGGLEEGLEPERGGLEGHAVADVVLDDHLQHGQEVLLDGRPQGLRLKRQACLTGDAAQDLQDRIVWLVRPV